MISCDMSSRLMRDEWAPGAPPEPRLTLPPDSLSRLHLRSRVGGADASTNAAEVQPARLPWAGHFLKALGSGTCPALSNFCFKTDPTTGNGSARLFKTPPGTGH